MSGFLAVFLPRFRLDRCGVSSDGDTPAVLVADGQGGERVISMTPAAGTRGVRLAMTLAEARGFCHDLHAERLDRESEVRDLRALAACMERHAPQVWAVPPDGLLFHGGPGLLAPVRQAIAALGHLARLVWAPDRAAALLLARQLADDRVIEASALRPQLAPIAVRALCRKECAPEDPVPNLPSDVVDTLDAAGIRTLASLASLPVASLSGRFGSAILSSHALARGEPCIDIPVPLLPPAPTERLFEQAFPEPVDSLDALLFVLHGLLRDVARALELQQQAVMRVRVRLRLAVGEHVIPVRLGTPGRSADRVFKLLRLRLERVRLEAEVVAVAVEVVDTCPYRPGQAGLFDRSDVEEPLADLVARLQDALGKEAIVHAVPSRVHRPEAAWRAVPEGEADPLEVEPARRDPAAAHEPESSTRPRPSSLLPDPVALRVVAAASGRPCALAGVPEGGAEWVSVRHADGPERLQGEWWQAQPLARDYWACTLDDGRMAWVFREVESDRWSLHGWFDTGRPAAPPSPPPRRASAPPGYAELVCRSHFSFCEGASSPAELVTQAASLGLSALAITDRDGLYGAVQAHRAARSAGLPLLHGSLLTVSVAGERRSASVLVQDRRGWSSLCRLLTAARFEGHDGPLCDTGAPGEPPPQGYRPDKAWATLPFERLVGGNDGLLVMLRGDWPAESVRVLHDACGDRLYQAVSRRLTPDEEPRIARLRDGPLPCVATNDVLMHQRSRQRLQDVLTCIRLGVPLTQAGALLQPNQERSLLDPQRMFARFRAWPDMLERTLEVQSRCTFSLDELRYRYPHEVVPDGYSAQAWLVELTRRGVYRRYRGRAPEAVQAQIDRELAIIDRLGFASYFLTVYDIVRFARSRDILCQGRGSAANSAVCYVLGVTPVDPARQQLLFERFISEERGEPPDIDIDFEHERREEVLQYVYRRYGRDRAAMVNEVIAWRGKMAVRDVGKALGYSADVVDQLARTIGHVSARSEEPADASAESDPIPDAWATRLREAGVDIGAEGIRHLVDLCNQIHGFPRHTSIHVGGFVIADEPLVDTAPIEPARMHDRTVLQWDKNDIDDLGFVKVDLLALGMLTALRKAFRLVQAWHGRVLDLSNIPEDDPAVYEMLGHADAMGVFQIESRAQQSMLPRLRPRNFYDLVVETAIVRPGPIQGGMVHPYLRRRSGEEPVTYADPRLEPILARTLGVPIFQEQVMAMAVAVGGFTPGEADQLRRAMGAWRRRGGLSDIGARLMEGMRRNGIAAEYAEAIFKQIQGFAEYGFPESHAASFAHLVYVSAWLRCHYPAAFVAALINSQPMGFYAPRSLIADAARHGVDVEAIDVTVSMWDCTLEGASDQPPHIRLGLRLVRGLREAAVERILRARQDAPFTSLPDLALRARLGSGELALLARADALRTLQQGQDRQAARWAVAGLLPGLFASLERPDDPALPGPTASDELLDDFASTGLSLRRHPVGLVRPHLNARGFTPLERLGSLPSSTVVRVAGLVSHRQRPSTASGVVFLTIEDETGSGNIVVWPKVYERQRALIRGQRLVEVRGRLECTPGTGPGAGVVLNVIAARFAPLDTAPRVAAGSRDFR